MRLASVMRPMVVMGLLGLAACSSAQFSGKASKSAEVPPAPGTPTPSGPTPGTPGTPSTKPVPTPPGVQGLTTTCQAGPVTAQAKGQAMLSGQLCLQATGHAAILFVVDYSGSMGRHRDNQQGGGQSWSDGSDPLTGGTCGRLQAAQAVLASVQQAATGGGSANVQVGFVPFAGDVLSDRVIPLTSLQTFQQAVNAQTFCSYVVQEADDLGSDNPGGIQDGGVDASTNYAAAFAAAAEVLQGASDTVVYFISDGEPTSGGSDPAQAGVRAGQQLMAMDQGLTLNGLLLGSDGAQAEQTLEAVVGSPDRVRVASQASQLSQEIVQFPSVAFAPGTQTATITGPDGRTQPLALQSFGPQAGAGASDVWFFQTTAFPVATAGKRTITVSARTKGGQTVRSTTTVNVGG